MLRAPFTSILLFIFYNKTKKMKKKERCSRVKFSKLPSLFLFFRFTIRAQFDTRYTNCTNEKAVHYIFRAVSILNICSTWNLQCNVFCLFRSYKYIILSTWQMQWPIDDDDAFAKSDGTINDSFQQLSCYFSYTLNPLNIMASY